MLICNIAGRLFYNVIGFLEDVGTGLECVAGIGHLAQQGGDGFLGLLELLQLCKLCLGFGTVDLVLVGFDLVLDAVVVDLQCAPCAQHNHCGCQNGNAQQQTVGLVGLDLVVVEGVGFQQVDPLGFLVPLEHCADGVCVGGEFQILIAVDLGRNGDDAGTNAHLLQCVGQTNKLVGIAVEYNVFHNLSRVL